MNTSAKIFEFIQKHTMLSPGDTVLAALSGGADSVCMLHILLELSEQLGITVAASHFNHMLRGAEADRDEAFSAELCKSLNVPFFAGRGDVSAYAKSHSLSTEEAARILRYSFLQETASSLNSAKIATAHNADDNAETVILNLTRGAGLAGMRGIPPIRGNIIRPILCLTRQNVENYLSSRNISYVTDSTNLEDNYSRNKLRHNVMPVLNSMNPRFAENLINSCGIIRLDEEYISAEADRIISENASNGRISASLLLSLHKSVSSRIIIKLSNTGLSSFLVDEVLALCKNPSPSAHLDLNGVCVHREYDDIVFGREEYLSFSEVYLAEGKAAVIPELNLAITLEKCIFTDNIHKSFTDYLFKTTDVYGKISIRSRQAGDKIKLRGSGCTKTLKKLFSEKHIPSHLRSGIPVISDEQGVLGVYKIGCDMRGEPTFGDKIYKINFKEISHL